MKPKLYIVRGLPGSGKTTLAQALATEVCEADQYFTAWDGTYTFDKAKLPEAHQSCQERVKAAMLDEVQFIAVSNTFVKQWEMKAYYTLAAEHGYEVTEITMSGILHPNVHGIPDETNERMRTAWEK